MGVDHLGDFHNKYRRSNVCDPTLDVVALLFQVNNRRFNKSRSSVVLCNVADVFWTLVLSWKKIVKSLYLLPSKACLSGILKSISY